MRVEADDIDYSNILSIKAFRSCRVFCGTKDFVVITGYRTLLSSIIGNINLLMLTLQRIYDKINDVTNA